MLPNSNTAVSKMCFIFFIIVILIGYKIDINTRCL